MRPFDVLVTSADTALIELIPDAFSVHTIKARARRNSSSSSGDGSALGGRHSNSATAAAAAAGRSPDRSMSMHQKQPWDKQQHQQGTPPRVRHSYSGPSSSNGSAAAAAAQQPLSPSMSTGSAAGGGSSPQANLADFFFARWQRGTPECLAAQRRFVESLAGYSLATYLLQVRALVWGIMWGGVRDEGALSLLVECLAGYSLATYLLQVSCGAGPNERGGTFVLPAPGSGFLSLPVISSGYVGSIARGMANRCQICYVPQHCC